jgi:hypothetical protein
MISASVQRYQRALYGWHRKINAVRDPFDALRVAAHEPSPEPLIRSTTTLTKAPRLNALAAIERDLMTKLAGIVGDDPELPHMMRLSRDHWPALYKSLEARMPVQPSITIEEEPVMAMCM